MQRKFYHQGSRVSSFAFTYIPVPGCQLLFKSRLNPTHMLEKFLAFDTIYARYATDKRTS